MATAVTITPDTEPAPQVTITPDAVPPSTFQKVEGKAEEYAGKALSAAGLPRSISDIPNWFQHLTGTAKDSEPWWANIREAVKNPTQENIVKAVPFFGPMSAAMAEDVRNRDYGGAAATLAGGLGGVAAAGQVGPGFQARSALKNAAAGAAPTATAAERLYQSALKPGPGSYSLPEVKSMVRTGLENEIPVSQQGVQKLSSLVDDLNSKIQSKIATGAQAGTTVNKYAVASRLEDTYGQMSKQVNPVKAQTAVGKSGNEFLANQPNEIPIDQAQAMKQGTYQQIRKSYGQLSNATVESQKALARGLKEEIVNAFPEIGQLNAKESQLLNLDGALEHAVRRIDNHQLMGIGTPLAVGGVAAATGSKALAVASGILKAALDDPVLKSKIAIALNKKGVSLPGANMRLAAYTNALANAQPRGGQANEQGNEQ